MPGMRYNPGVKGLFRILVNAATVLSLILCAPAMWLAIPDRTTTIEVVLTTEETFNSLMSRDMVSHHLIRGRAGHHVVELPSETYGKLFVSVGIGRVRLRTALIVLLMLPIVWCAVATGRLVHRARHTAAEGRLRWSSAAVSLLVVLLFVVWWTRWPAPNRRPATVAFGNGLYRRILEKHPSAWPTEPDYCFYCWGFSIPFAGIITVASIWPAVTVMWWGRRLVAARVANRIGRCAGCGYDLRATPDRCPECGKVSEASAAIRK